MASTSQVIHDYKKIINETWKPNMEPVELITYTSEMIEKILLLNCREELDDSYHVYGCDPKVIGNVIDDYVIGDKISCITEYIIKNYHT